MRIVSWFAAPTALAVLLQGSPPDAVVSQRVAAALRAIHGAMADVVPALVVAIADQTRTLGVAARGYADIKTKRRTAASNGGGPLVAVGPALVKPATPEFNPERYAFDSMVDGHALRLIASGVPMYRVNDQ